MGTLPAPFRVGDFEIRRIVEMTMPFRTLAEMFPAATEAELSRVIPRLAGWCIDDETRILIEVQSYLVRTPRHVILLDTCIGCDKTNPRLPIWAGRTDTLWLDRLAQAGVGPEDVTHVLCTHLHPDHVGWNTRLVDGRWVPTFPNARYIISARDVAHGRTTPAEADFYRESVLPVIEAGQAQLVEMDHQIEDGIWLEPTPGHTPGHVAIHLESRGEHAVMWGDLLHSPVQAAYPHWAYARDVDPVASTESRRRVLGACCERNHLVLTGHFPAPSIGRIRAEGDAWWFLSEPGA